MRKLVKLVVLALAALGANTAYVSYKNAQTENAADAKATDQPLLDDMHGYS